MYHIQVFLFFLFINFTCICQIEKELDLEKFTTHFTIENNEFTEDGATFFKTKIAQIQFFMLGEEHFVSEISLFTNAIIPLLANEDFTYFITETGPCSTEKLQKEFLEKGSLYNFNTNNYKVTKDSPIPFFDGIEDEMFLKTALNNKFRVYGIDQEYYSSYFFLIEDIYNQTIEKEKIQLLYETAKRILISEYQKYASEDNYKMHSVLLTNPDLDKFFKSTDSTNTKIQKIITDLKTSWLIYSNFENKIPSNTIRMEYMKSNFGQLYKQALKNEHLPKMFLKMGAVHTSIGMNSLGIYDIGNSIKELSYLNNTKSASFVCCIRYRFDEHKNIIDELDNQPEEFKLILSLGKKDVWTIVDNQSIVNYYKSITFKMGEPLKNYLLKYDYILIPPIVSEIKINYKIEK